MNKTKMRLKKLYELIKKPEMKVLPGHLAFFLVLSIVPLILLFAMIAAQFSVSVDIIVNFINVHLPKEIGNVLIPFFTDGNLDFSFNVILLIFLGLFIASNGLYSVIVAANMLYKDESPNAFKSRLKSIILTVFLLFLFVFMIVVMAFGDSIMLYFKHVINADLIYSYIYYMYILIKWPFAFIYIFIVINLIYAVTPEYKIKSRSVFMGSIFTTLTWIVATYLYSYYVANFSRYDLIYGSLSSLIIMMIWIYFLSYLFIIGLAINASKFVKEEASEEVLNEGNDKII